MKADVPNVAESDQLDARVRDLCAVHGLEVVRQNQVETDWVRTHTAEELLDGWIAIALAASEEGALSALAAVTLSADDTRVGFTFAILRKAEESA